MTTLSGRYPDPTNTTAEAAEKPRSSQLGAFLLRFRLRKC